MEHESVQHWQEKLGIYPGIGREQALEKFREWRDSMKTCERCEDKELTKFCPVYSLCIQSNEEVEENGRKTVGGEGCNGNPEAKKVGFGLDETKRPKVGKGL
jgi:hypothetical protein